MAYFRNNTVNLLNLHYGLHSFAASGSGAFFGVFRSRRRRRRSPCRLQGFCSAAFSSARAYSSLPSAGVKPLLIAGTIVTSLQYPLLADVDGISVGLFIAQPPQSATRSIDELSAYFAALGDAGHRGHQVGAREAVAAVVGMIGHCDRMVLTALDRASRSARRPPDDACGATDRVDAECRVPRRRRARLDSHARHPAVRRRCLHRGS
jgi:hypothetical protein